MLMLMATSASAELIDRSGGLIYDTDLNVTWLQDANMGGERSWQDAGDWASSLVYQGYSDWRLPVSSICRGHSCFESEMGQLYYNEGITAQAPVDFQLNSPPSFSFIPHFFRG